MSAVQLAKRLSVSRAAVYKLEEREVSRSIALKQLERAASAMDFDILLRTEGQVYTGREYEDLVLRTYPDGTRLTLGDVSGRYSVSAVLAR